MASFLLLPFTLFILFIIIFFLVIYKKLYIRSTKTSSFSQLKPAANEHDYNPDINTKNWDLHKIRLNKFGRSQYKGLTFFINTDERIYYISEKGTKVYC